MPGVHLTLIGEHLTVTGDQTTERGDHLTNGGDHPTLLAVDNPKTPNSSRMVTRKDPMAGRNAKLLSTIALSAPAR